MTVVGTVIGRYQLLRLLASGGMGEVYLARLQSSVDGFGALVAIKVLVKSLSANQAFVRMFLDEARVVGKLHHKNIVQIRDVAEQDGQYYMVMEYIPGQNLRELLGDLSIPDRSLFEPRLGTEMFVDIVGALAEAHAAGLVHRDISPNNIMISDEGVPKLIDFGVARALGTTSLTTPGTLKGKFGYMAPEYVRAQAYDHRVDIFSLGVVMWETFARRRLFRGTSAAEQLHQLLESQIPPLTEVVPGFPPALASIIAAAVERDPQRRISSAAMLGDSLFEIARSLPVGKDATLRKWLERRIPVRLEDRRQTDQALLELAPGSPIPDFGIAYPGAGSSPGTYGFQEAPIPAPAPSGAFRFSNTGQSDAGSLRLGNGEAEAPPAPTVRRGGRGRLVVIAAAAVLGLLAVLFLANRDTPSSAPAPETTAATTAATTTTTAPPPPASATTAATAGSAEVSLAEAHRQIGLKAMSDGDYVRARKEYEEAIRNGGAGDLPELLEIAKQLESDTQARAPEPTVAPTVEPTVAPTVAATADSKGPPRTPTKVAVATPGRRTPPPPRRKEPAARDQASSTRTPQTPPNEVTPPPPPAPTTGTLVVTMADDKLKGVVYVDGNMIGTTPLREPRLPLGEHQLVVRVGDQTVRSQKILIMTSPNVIRVDPVLPKAAPVVAVTPTPPPAPKPAALPATPRVTADGDVGTGARVVAGCNACHAKAGKSGFSPRRYTRAQWERFFANGQHDRAVPIGAQMSASQMMAARAYLRANAADTAENQGAGIRE